MIKFDNAAEAAGLAAQVAAFDGDGSALARNMLLAKIAPAFRTILGNSDGPLMDLFREFSQRPANSRSHHRRRRGARPAAASGPGPARAGQASHLGHRRPTVSEEDQP